MTEEFTVGGVLLTVALIVFPYPSLGRLEIFHFARTYAIHRID